MCVRSLARVAFILVGTGRRGKIAVFYWILVHDLQWSSSLFPKLLKIRVHDPYHQELSEYTRGMPFFKT